jgi:hypothetical protein
MYTSSSSFIYTTQHVAPPGNSVLWSLPCTFGALTPGTNITDVPALTLMVAVRLDMRSCAWEIRVVSRRASLLLHNLKHDELVMLSLQIATCSLD